MNRDQPLASQSVESALAEVTDRFLEAMRQGERPSVEEYAQAHPMLASVLRMVLPALAGVHAGTVALEQEYGAGGQPGLEDQGHNQNLGDYRILREVGRGGMGVVYEAEQISLSRRVALKILPFAAVLDPRHLQRFKNEAMAAAHLDHPNIVEVYGIGCERSIHFYAMRFIEGVTLADVVEAKRRNQAGNVAARHPQVESSPKDEARTEVFSHSSDSSLSAPHASLAAATSPVLQAALSTVNSISPKERFRRIAEIGIEAAEALDHAHQMGIVHRDIKPSNLMLDERGKLWVTDFGLARSTGEASMTMTGDLVGTLRYMSPEQALAKRITVDHRTDIYSLGVTLYELLTLRAAFPSNDREETLRQIAFEEPTAPRKLDKAIPEELETIILKAMEKNPDDRYATAREVAEDLRRWVEHKPIAARAPGVVLKAKKWARRHSGLTATALGILFATTLVLSTAVALINRAYNDQSEQREIANREAELAKHSLDRALTAINKMTAFGSHELVLLPGAAALRKSMLQDAVTLCDSLRKSYPANPNLGATVIVASFELAELEYLTGNHQRADELGHHASATSRDLLHRLANNPVGLATVIDRLTVESRESTFTTFSYRSAMDSTIVDYIKALQLHPMTVNTMRAELSGAARVSLDTSTPPGLPAFLFSAIERANNVKNELDLECLRQLREIRLGMVFRHCNSDAATRNKAGLEHVTACRRAIESANNPDDSAELIQGLYRLGDATLDQQEARELFTAALELGDTLPVRRSNEDILRDRMAQAHFRFAMLWRQDENLPMAERHSRQSVELFRSDIERVRVTVSTAFSNSAVAFEELAQIVELQERYDEVRALYRDEIEMWCRLVSAKSPPDTQVLGQLVDVYYSLGLFELRQGNVDLAKQAYGKAEEVLRANIHSFSSDRGRGELTLAFYLSNFGRTDSSKCEAARKLYARYSPDEESKRRNIAITAVDRGGPTPAIDVLRADRKTHKLDLALAEAQCGNRDLSLEALRAHLIQPRAGGRTSLRYLDAVFGDLERLLNLSIDDVMDLNGGGGPDLDRRTARLIRWLKRPRPPKPNDSVRADST